MELKNISLVESTDGSLFSLETLAKIQDNWIDWVLNCPIYKIEDKIDGQNWHPAILVNEDCWNFFINNGIEGYSKDKFNYLKSGFSCKDFLLDENINFNNPLKEYYSPTIYIYYKNSDNKDKWFGVPINNKNNSDLAELFEPLKYIWIEWLEKSVYKLLLPEYLEE